MTLRTSVSRCQPAHSPDERDSGRARGYGSAPDTFDAHRAWPCWLTGGGGGSVVRSSLGLAASRDGAELQKELRTVAVAVRSRTASAAVSG